MADTAALCEENAELCARLEAGDAEVAALQAQLSTLDLKPEPEVEPEVEPEPTMRGANFEEAALEVDGGRVAPAEGEMERELFAAIRAKNKERVRELLEMEADVNAYEPKPCVRARDLRCVSLSRAADRARN